MKKQLLVLAALPFMTAIGAETEKSLVDFFLPMEPVSALVGSDATWGSNLVVPRDTANGLEDPDLSNSCYWDGGVVKGDDGRYYMYASRWSQGVSHHDGWTRNSMACMAVSDNVMGPYREERLIWPKWTPEYFEDKEIKDYAMPGWGSNVFGFRMHDGRYGVVSSEITPGEVFACETPNGDFEYLGRIKVDYNGFPEGLAAYGWNNHMSNVMILPRPDGKYMIIARSMAPMISEDGVTGPYKIVNYPVYSQRLDLYQGFNEDPTVWYSGGMYHVMYNYWPEGKCHHFTSKDGLTDWRYRGVAFDKHNTKIFRYTDGTVNDWGMIERPTAVMGDDGHVSHFLFSVVESKGGDEANDRDGSKIVVVPFDGKAFDEYMAEVVKNDPAVEARPIDASNADGDTNVLNSLVYSFEQIGPNVACMWHLQHKDNYIPTTEKAYDGEYSMKYELNDPTVKTDLQIQGNFNSDLIKPIFEDGEYELSMYFWADTESPTKVDIPFIASNKYFSVSFDLTEIKKKEWVKLTQKVRIEDLADKRAKTNIIIRGGQQGTVYMDKMELIRVSDIAEEKGLGNAKMMSFELKDGTKAGVDGWYIPNTAVWSHSDVMSSEGDYSLCFTAAKGTNAADATINTDDGDNGNVDNSIYFTKTGNYHIAFDLYLDAAKNKGLKSLQMACAGSGWKSGWFPGWLTNIQTLEKGKWVTVKTPQINVAEIVNADLASKITFKVPKDADDADDVLFYIDNVRVVNEDAATGLDQITSSSVSISTYNGSLLVEGACRGEVIGVYDIMGRLINSTKVTTDNSVVIPIASGCYFVRVGDFTKKVII